MKLTASTDFSQLKDEELNKFVELFAKNVAEVLNGKLTFSDNSSAVTVAATFSIVNTDTAVVHNLGRVPAGYIVVGTSVAMSVYNGSSTNSASLLYLKSSATGSAQVLVF